MSVSSGTAELRNIEMASKGSDICKQFFANLLFLYDETGITRVNLNAVDIGVYAWAKYGFTPDQDTIDRFHEELFDIVGGKYLPKTPPSHLCELAAVAVSSDGYNDFENKADESGIWGEWNKRMNPVKPIYWSDDGFSLGKYFLLAKSFFDGELWEGTLDLTDTLSRGILEGYIKYSDRKPNL